MKMKKSLFLVLLALSFAIHASAQVISEGVSIVGNGGIKAEVDASGNLKTSLGTTIAGEDTVNDRMKVEGRFSFQNIATSTTTTPKSGVGVLHTVVVTNIGATGNSITIYDNTAGSGTIITTMNPPVVGSYTFDVDFSVGLTVVTAGTTPPNVTVTYR